MEAELDTKEFIVIDNGSGFIKAGYSGQDAPRFIMPTVVGKFEPTEPGRPAITKLGHDLDLKSPGCPLSFPIERGVVRETETDWEYMRDIWLHIITNELQEDPSTANVLITDSPLNSRENRLKMAELMFNSIGVSSLGIMSTAVLDLFATGRTRGLVVDSGDGLTCVVPVFEGYALPHAIRKMPLAGTDITNFILQKLSADLKPSQFAVARGIKEQMLVVPNNFDNALRGPDLISEDERCYELPGGKIIKMDKQTRLEAAELLFRPSILDRDADDISTETVRSILKCDSDLRADMYGNIILAGGTSMMRGFHQRMEHELRAKLPKDIAYDDIRVVSDSFREHAAWIGGSMLASLSTFPQFMTMSKGQWDEEGTLKPALIQKYSF
jgi:actin